MITNELCVIKTILELVWLFSLFVIFCPTIVQYCCGRAGTLSCLFSSCLSQGLSMAMKSRSFPMASSTTWPRFLICKSCHTGNFLLPALNRWACQVCTHVEHTHTQTHKSGQTAGECGRQWPVCSPLWWAPQQPKSPWSATVLRLKQHTEAFNVSSPCHISETHRHKRADSAWSVECRVCILVFNMVCVVAMWLWAYVYVQRAQRDIGGGRTHFCEISLKSLREKCFLLPRGA